MGKKPDDILGRVSTLADGDSSRDIYDEWSGSYDDHLLDEFGYISPEVAASALAAESDSRDLAVMDLVSLLLREVSSPNRAAVAR